jgi:hypothetical protein
MVCGQRDCSGNGDRVKHKDSLNRKRACHDNLQDQDSSVIVSI